MAEPSAEPQKRLLVGCLELPPGMNRGQYFQKLPLLEIASFVTSPPSRKAVRTWREKSPPHARYAVQAHAILTSSGLASSDAAAKTTAELADACQILEAEAVVFRTPAGFAPSAQNRARLKEYFGQLATAEAFGNTARVWAPDGLWEPQTIGEVCDKLELLPGLDALVRDPFEEHEELLEAQFERGQVYLRLQGLGRAKRRFDTFELETLAERIADCQRAWVLFGNPDKYADALRFARALGVLESED